MTTQYTSKSSSESDRSDFDSRTSASSVEEETVLRSTKTTPTSSDSEKETSGFIARVSSIPLIHDSVSTLTSYAEANKYSKYALDTAGSAVTTASKYTEGYQSRLQPLLQPHISKVDQLAIKSLDLFENTFPIVTKPTAEIVAEVKKPIVYVEESSKSAYTQIQSTIDTHVNTRAVPLVNGLETIVNHYLPQSSDSESEETTTGEANQATRIIDLSRSVTRRVSRRVSVSVSPVTQSAQDLRRAAESNAVVIRSKESIQSLNIRLTALLETLRVHAKELQENVQEVPGKASTRVTELSSNVLAEIDSLSVYLKEHRSKLPEYVQSRLEPLAGFINDRYVLVKGEITKNDVPAIQKARNILHLTTEETLPILQNAAQDVRESLLQYQAIVQENVNKGLTKVQTVNSSVSEAAARAVQSARVTLVGAK
ncbi:MAG: hypothetical protein BYD32DRAFT_362995 [Podila humilis]|nr:MAG: hypothetical protein BYD32DRAFT_362995 [Podila humilis]